jgi:hypothetical protein
MTVRELNNILSGMPEDAEVVICPDPALLTLDIPEDEYQPFTIKMVAYDSSDNTVELRANWS